MAANDGMPALSTGNGTYRAPPGHLFGLTAKKQTTGRQDSLQWRFDYSSMTLGPCAGGVGEFAAGQGRKAMLSVASALLSRLAPTEAISRRDALALAIISSLHLAALAVMTATELDFATKATFLLVWASLNFFWLALLRRPTIAALLSLTMVVGLILLSQFKYDKLMMTVNFVDLMIIDPDTSAFLFTIMPRLRGLVVVGVLVAIPLLALLWRIDPFRIRVRTSALGGTLCMGALVVLSIAYPADLYGEFFNQDYVSKFARSGVEAIYEFATHGLLESDATVTERLK